MTHFEEMEALGQVTIFDVLNFAVGDRVRVIITQESDDEAYTCLKAYHPSVFEKPGKIVEVLPKNQYKVNFAGELHIMRLQELQLDQGEENFKREFKTKIRK